MDYPAALLGAGAFGALGFAVYWFSFHRRYVLIWAAGLLTAGVLFYMVYLRVMFLIGGS